jgi:hypothetical protein
MSVFEAEMATCRVEEIKVVSHYTRLAEMTKSGVKTAHSMFNKFITSILKTA